MLIATLPIEQQTNILRIKDIQKEKNKSGAHPEMILAKFSEKEENLPEMMRWVAPIL